MGQIVSCFVFKRLQYVIVKPIIYNQLFSVAFVPSEWKKAVITPVHKKGPATTCSNYRPIAITCVTPKLLKRVIVNQIRNYLVSSFFCGPCATFYEKYCENRLSSFFA